MGLVAGLMTCSALAAALLASSPAQAQVQQSGKTLPLALAQEAAQEAVRQCEASGYRVSASVVDVAGVERVFLRGDHSTIHTRETAFKKAYTVATLGPIFGATTSSALTERISKTPTGPALVTVSNIILLAGGVALRSGDETLAAIGVGGAPGGALDESCAQAGVAKVQERLNALGR
ncbi:MAG: heme-binding protein [Burkholderiales bacterium]|nr:MAG: heme-binding protein [Burkholderiales bacterium]